MACWLQVDRGDRLLAKAAASSWACGDGVLAGATARPAVWERQRRRGDVSSPGAAHAGAADIVAGAAHDDCGAAASHDVIWAPRAEGAVGIHRFRPADGAAAGTALLLAQLQELGQQEMAAGATCDPASNVGGFHGARDLWLRPELWSTDLPTTIGAALKQATRTEATALGQVPVTTSCDEAWFNVTGPDGWNRMHTHAGSTYACVCFIADGGCCKAEQFGGRLCFVTNQPDTLPDYHLQHVRRRDGSSEPRLAGKRRKVEPKFLLLDPEPGTIVIFPAFLPHFVLPQQAQAAEPAADMAIERPLRMSIALNFGASDPIIMQWYVGRDADGPCVRVFLEVEEVYGI